MMPTEIDRVKAIIDKKMKEEVIRVLNGETSSVDIYYCRPADIVSYIESIGGSRGDMETHGWEWDFWLEIKYKNQDIHSVWRRVFQ